MRDNPRVSVDIEATCSVHPGHQAVGRCARCTRATCLACAVPVRGTTLCRECALREVPDHGAAGPAPAPARRRLDVLAAAFLGVAGVATIIPWHRFGILTSILSAWRPEAGWWAPVASASILAGGITAAWWARRPSGGRGRLRAYTALAALATVATGGAVVAAPPFVSHTPAPFVVLGASAAACVIGSLVLRSSRA
jgi:cobalamin synthase